MNKKIRQIWWGIILLLAIIVVYFLMFWWKKMINNNVIIEPQTWLPSDSTNEEIKNDNSFKKDVMTDLESFFNGWNGYEDIEWDFWFINPNAE